MFKIIVTVIKCIPILIYFLFNDLFNKNPKKCSRVKSCNILSDKLGKILIVDDDENIAELISL